MQRCTVELAEVSRGHSTPTSWGRAEHQEVLETGRIREECKESRQLHHEGEGWPLEVGVEPRDKAGALSISPASEGRRNDSTGSQGGDAREDTQQG